MLSLNEIYNSNMEKFIKFNNFYLNHSSWGSAPLKDIVSLLDSVITDFYSNLDNSKINTSPVIVLNSSSLIPPIDYPMIVKEMNITFIYLYCNDLFWSKYSYQFAHELCHFVIYKEFPSKNGKFDWLEETICELASLYTMNKMSITWQTNPPYKNWRDYSVSLKKYVDDKISQPEYNISILFKDWLKNNLPDLYKDRYKRTENTIIDIHLLPIFTNMPELWQIIQYMKDIFVFDDMTLEQYLSEWKKLIPPDLYSGFDLIVDSLT